MFCLRETNQGNGEGKEFKLVMTDASMALIKNLQLSKI